MPFIPHTEEDIRAMLQAIGIASIDELFDEIPPALRSAGPMRVPAATTEMAIARIMHDRAERDGTYLNFIGAGAYEHHIPAAVWQIATRGEFYSSYTPYQAEASQGTLQLLYEYQTMMSSLLALDATNASLYDGASALAEAALMAVRAHKSAKRVLIPRTVHPIWRKVVRTITRNQGIELFEIDYDRKTGHVSPASLALFEAQDIAALVIPQPNFFGVLEPVDELVAWAHTRGALAIAAVNPIALALLRPPGEWAAGGADIAVGEGSVWISAVGVPVMRIDLGATRITVVAARARVHGCDQDESRWEADGTRGTRDGDALGEVSAREPCHVVTAEHAGLAAGQDHQSGHRIDEQLVPRRCDEVGIGVDR